MSDDNVQQHLTALYGEAKAAGVFARLSTLLDEYRVGRPGRPRPTEAGLALSERDAILITYGDQVQRLASAGGLAEPPLQTLARFCRKYLSGVVSGIHLLPFYPYSSDDGFSVIDYQAVNPALGSWSDVASLGQSFRLMFDAVINHVSAHSAWFQGFVRGEARYREYFITVEGNPDLSQVVRPRALPLLTPVETSNGVKQVWTTFSADQFDLNYANPDVLLAVLETLLFYVAQGAEFLRLDAIAYLWKEIGTPSIHLPQTHRVIQLLRAVLDEVAPWVLLITETNVPHADNISYFGDGRNEAQLVYNFALPPLTLHAFHTGSARVLSEWASGLERPSGQVTFFNFLASHDGVGVNPARGILAEADVEALVQRVQDHGGLVSYKHNPDGTQSPYELNANYFDALSDPRSGEPIQRQVARFTASQAIMLALVGLPGIYFHSLFGSRGWPEGVRQTGRNRSINRQKLDEAVLNAELEQPEHRRRAVYERLAHLLKARASTQAFHPTGGQRVMDYGDGVFALLRTSPAGGARALCLHDVSGQARSVRLDLSALDWGASAATDLIDGRWLRGDNGGRLEVRLGAYGVAWLVPAA